MSARLWIVTPVYFDVEPFLVLRERVLAVLAQSLIGPYEVRFVVIDDTAGRDGNIMSLRALSGTTILTPPFGLGHQRAIVFGLRSIAADVVEDDLVVTMDADGEDQPEDLTRLLAPVIKTGADRRRVALARRTRRRETLPFKALYLGFRLLFRTLTGFVMQTGNYAAFHGWLARNVIFHPFFDLCYSSSLLSLSPYIEYVPCARGARYAGRSKMSYFKLIVHGMRMLMPFIDRIAVRALLASAVIFGVSLMSAVAFGAVALVTQGTLPWWTTSAMLVVALLLLAAIAVMNFLVLFTVFSQSQGVSLSGLERGLERRAPTENST